MYAYSTTYIFFFIFIREILVTIDISIINYPSHLDNMIIKKELLESYSVVIQLFIFYFSFL
jgi:hypothetical protein